MFHIIDDTRFVREMLAIILENQGFKVELFENARDYLRYANSPDFSYPLCVITDINMPMMNGYEMIKVLSLSKPSLRYVIVTAEVGIRDGYEDKVVSSIPKPFTEADVSAAVKDMKCATIPSVHAQLMEKDNNSMFSKSSFWRSVA